MLNVLWQNIFLYRLGRFLVHNLCTSPSYPPNLLSSSFLRDMRFFWVIVCKANVPTVNRVEMAEITSISLFLWRIYAVFTTAYPFWL